MKTLHLAIILIVISLLVPFVLNNTVNGCLLNPDWPNAPCYAIPGIHVTKEQMKKDWAGYYQYKGLQWMEMKRAKMANATEAGLLKAWACKSTTNYDVWQYYYLNDQAPSIERPMNGPMCDIPPLQQLKVGTKIGEIGCGYDLYLLVNKESSLPSCVKLTSIPRLLGLGWEHLGTYLNDTEPYSPTITAISITTRDFTDCKFCETKSENVTVVIGTNSTVRWINTTPSPIWFLPHQNNDDMAFYNSAIFPLGGHIGGLKFPAYLYAGQDFEYTFTKPGKFVWNTNPQFMGWVTVLSQNNTWSQSSYSSDLRLSLSLDSTLISSDKSIGVDISLDNISTQPVRLEAQDFWAIGSLSPGPCIYNMPVGISVMKGYFTGENMSKGIPLDIFNGYEILCPAPNMKVKTYVFEPMSSKADITECVWAMPKCAGSIDTKDRIVLDGTWNRTRGQTFETGTYTVTGGDEWGDVAIRHFTVTNSTGD
ncbi:MAG: hypothetical protein ACREBB_04995 [Nitrosotalea sp.]